MSKNWVPIYCVDAFSSKPFGGNPAAVCFINCDLDSSIYQSIASEMEHPETAFLEKIKEDEYKLRWFTPKVEIKLCGHATLATAHVLFNDLKIKSEQIHFHTLSGLLKASKTIHGIQLDFPRDDSKLVEAPEEIIRGLGLNNVAEAVYGPNNMYLILIVEDVEEIYKLKPDFTKLIAAKMPFEIKAVSVTAKGTGEYDFVSRFFAPWLGIPEDPVTGSAHTILAPYWSEKLGKKNMCAYQASARGGELLLKLDDERVYLSGSAITILKGELLIGNTFF